MAGRERARKPRIRSRLSPDLRAYLSREKAVINIDFPVFPIRGDPPVLEISADDYDLEPFRTVPGGGTLGSSLAAAAALVCRIDAASHANDAMTHRGTGVLVAPDLVLTCRHVVASFALPTATKNWQFKADGARATVHFGATPDDDPENSIAVSGIVFAGSKSSTKLALNANEPEIALLRLSKRAAAPAQLFDWAVNREAVDELRQAVAVVSYPGNPFESVTGEQRKFSDPALSGVPAALVTYRFEPSGAPPLYGTRCLTIGMRRNRQGTDRYGLFAAHDCSTLGGSSGGAVIDLLTGRIIGIHCGGEFTVENQFQLLWSALNRIGRFTDLRKAMMDAGIPDIPGG